MEFSIVAANRGLLFIVVHRLLIAVAFLVTETRLYGEQASVVVACGLSSVVIVLFCSAACGIFPDQSLNLCPLNWQADS